MPIVLYVATIAGGGGDIAFAARVIAALHRRHATVLVAVLAQGGVCATAAAAAVFSDCPPLCNAEFIGSWQRFGESVQPSSTTVSASSTTLRATAARTVDAVLQGPLHCFDCALSACAALGVPASPAVYWLSLREFGMATMLPPGDAGSASAGLADGELGIFGLDIIPLPLAATLHTTSPTDALFVGYYRTGRHGSALGRLVASVLALRGAPSPSRARVLLPIAASACVAAFISGLRSHPAVAAAYVAATGASDGLGAETREVLLEFRSAAAGRTTLLLEDVHALAPEERASFRALLAFADGAVVSGDATLNEALAYGAARGPSAAPWWYSTEPHKRGVNEALRALVAPTAECLRCAPTCCTCQCAAAISARRVVCTWWSLLDSADAGAAARLWIALLEELVVCSRSGSCDGAAGSGNSSVHMLDTLRAAFGCWCGSVVRMRGGLADALIAQLGLQANTASA